MVNNLALEVALNTFSKRRDDDDGNYFKICLKRDEVLLLLLPLDIATLASLPLPSWNAKELSRKKYETENRFITEIKYCH